jgi:hypothetical protein
MIRKTFTVTAVLTALAGFVTSTTIDAIEVAEELLIELDAEHPSAGTGEWINTGTSGGSFIETGDPFVEQAFGDLGTGGASGVNFNSTGTLDVYISNFDADPGLIGPNPTRTIEVWALNPSVVGTESMVAWSRRGLNGDGGNMSFNYGKGKEGAVTQWSDTDLDWLGDNPPAAGTWHHLVYTFDGTTTRVYSDGVLNNSEVLGADVINTAAGPIAIGTQFQGDGNPQMDIRGTLTIALVRIHDGVLSDSQIQMNYDEEQSRFTRPQFVPRLVLPVEAELDDVLFTDETQYLRQLSISGDPTPQFSLEVSPVQDSASISANGLVVIDVTNPPPGAFDVTVTATNEVAGNPTELMIDWTVDVQPALQRGDVLQVVGELFVDLDASDTSAGTETWFNNGTVGDFVIDGTPQASSAAGVASVAFNADGGTSDTYATLDPAPAGLVGVNATSTIEVWVFNPTIEDEESMISWSKRNSSGRNMSFNYGSSGIWGAASRWGSADMPWNPAPTAAEWHLLTLTYDGQTQRAYIDGVLNNSEFLGAGAVDVFDDTAITLGNQREADGNLATGFRSASLHIGRLRVHDGVLKPVQILHNYEEELCNFVPNGPLECTDNLLFMEDQIVASGQTQVTVPVRLNTTAIRHAISLSMTYDPARLALTDVSITGTVSAGSTSIGRFCNDTLNGCVQAGALTWSILPGLSIDPDDWDEAAVIPFGEGQVIANLHFDVIGLPSQSSTEIAFADGVRIGGVPGLNSLTTRTIGTRPALQNGVLTRAPGDDGACCLGDGSCVVLSESDCVAQDGTYQGAGIDCGSDTCPTGTPFRRGDHDGSGLVDITDPLNLLGFLFLGTTPPICEDASDGDNSSALDISDALNVLGFLFLGSFPLNETLPGPSGCGSDPDVIIDPDGPGGFPEQPAASLGCDMYPNPTFLPGAACP